MSQPCIVCGATDHDRVQVNGVEILACPQAPADRPVWVGTSAERFAELAERETREWHEHMDRKEAELDAHGYGGDPSKPRPQVVGLMSPAAIKAKLESGELPSRTRAGALEDLFLQRPPLPDPAELAKLGREAAKAWEELRADVDALKKILGSPTFYVRSASESPPREDYVRATVEMDGHTYEPAIEYRDGDTFDVLVADLEHAASLANRPDLTDPIKRARYIGAALVVLWPDRAYFVEVWQNGRKGFAQSVQPFGFPRNR